MIRGHHVGGVAVYAKAGNIVSRAAAERLVGGDAGHEHGAARRRRGPGRRSGRPSGDGARSPTRRRTRSRRPAIPRARAPPAARTRATSRRLGIVSEPRAGRRRDAGLQPAARRADVRHRGRRRSRASPARISTGLQASGRVVGVLKHFPGLGAVAEDPHQMLPRLDTWHAPSSRPSTGRRIARCIGRGDVHAIMVSHVIVDALDPTRPRSLAPAVVTGALRDASRLRRASSWSTA